MRLEKEVLMEMLKEQIAVNTGRQQLHIGLSERSHASSTKEDIPYEVGESNQPDKGKRKMAEVPIFDSQRDRHGHDVLEPTRCPSVHDQLRGRVTSQVESQLRN